MLVVVVTLLLSAGLSALSTRLSSDSRSRGAVPEAVAGDEEGGPQRQRT